ncbi:MAG TPA: amidohydrolase [Thermoanaerobaculia bacterium]|nr:amidohydrolase [Thermoanaerobaculia bacterium]
MRARRWSISTLVLVSLSAGDAQAQSALLSPFTEKLEADRATLIELRRDIHRHPETSGKEERTAGLVAERLRAAGYEVRTGVGGHGVIGVLRGGKPGPIVAYRADMDAVPSDDPDPVEFRSLTPGVRHICGHDVHTTIGVAMAQGFASIKDLLPGTVIFLFQPAEENATGAKAMLADGAFERLKPDAIFAVHTAPFPVGHLVTAPGVLMSGRDLVRVTVQRAPDEAATANAVRDRLLALSTVTGPQVLAPSTPDFVFVQAQVVAPSGADTTYAVEGSISMASQQVRSRTHEAVTAAIAELRGDDTVLALQYEELNIAGVDNDTELVKRATSAVDSVLGAGSVSMLEQVVPAFSEDFGSFQAQVPGVMFFLGVSNPEKGTVGMPHSPGYVADEESILVGAKAMAAVLLDFLESR